MQGGIDPELPGDGVLRPRARGEAARARRCTCTRSARWRSSTAPPHRTVDRGLPDQGAASPGSTRSPAPPRRSSTTTSAGCSPRASCRPATWIEVVTHRAPGGHPPTSSTMMYGHVDNPRHWVSHLRVLSRHPGRSVEAGVGVHRVRAAAVRAHTPRRSTSPASPGPGPTLRDNLAVHAMARIMLHGRIDNIQTSWVKLGVDGTRAMLRAGANDLGGTLMEETISRMAGSEHGSAKTVAELAEIARRDRPPGARAHHDVRPGAGTVTPGGRGRRLFGLGFSPDRSACPLCASARVGCTLEVQDQQEMLLGCAREQFEGAAVQRVRGVARGRRVRRPPSVASGVDPGPLVPLLVPDLRRPAGDGGPGGPDARAAREPRRDRPGPPAWLHLTLCDIGFLGRPRTWAAGGDDADGRRRARLQPPLDLTLGPVRCFSDSVTLDAGPRPALLELRRRIGRAMELRRTRASAPPRVRLLPSRDSWLPQSSY